MLRPISGEIGYNIWLELRRTEAIMFSLLHNWLTDLALPDFLALYAGAGMIALVAGSVWIWLCDGTRDDDLSDPCPDMDPYENAFLRGGPKRVSLLALFDLTQRGYLASSVPPRRMLALPSSTRIHRVDSAATGPELTPIQRVVWNWLAAPQSPAHLHHRHLGLLKQMRSECESSFDPPLAKRRFLETAGRKRARQIVRVVLTTAFVSVGTYKLITSALTGQGESITLILMMLAGVTSLAIICRPVRLSDLGHRHLEHLEREFRDSNHAPICAEAAAMQSTDEDYRDRLLEMALFGTVGTRTRQPHLDFESSSR